MFFRFLIFSLNFFLYIQVYKSIRKKKILLSQNHNFTNITCVQNLSSENITPKNKVKNSAKSTNLRNREDDAYKKLTVMVMLGSLNCFFNRFPFLISNIKGKWLNNNIPFYIYLLILHSTYGMYFFLYFYSNKKFRKTCQKYWHKLMIFFHIKSDN